MPEPKPSFNNEVINEVMKSLLKETGNLKIEVVKDISGAGEVVYSKNHGSGFEGSINLYRGKGNEFFGDFTDDVYDKDSSTILFKTSDPEILKKLGLDKEPLTDMTISKIVKNEWGIKS